MQKILKGTIFFLFIYLNADASIDLKKEPLDVRVRIAADLSSVRVRGFDLRFLEGNSNSDSKIVFKTDQFSEWDLSCESGSIRVKEVRSFKNQPWFTRLTGFQKHDISPLEGKNLVLKSPLLVKTPAGFLTFQDKPYRNEIRIYANHSGCDVVNHLGLESYLRGLINREFSSKWSEEAVEAQAVVARTYAYFQIQQNKKSPTRYFDLDASTKDQVYDGSVHEDFKASRAIQKTGGFILTTTGLSAVPKTSSNTDSKTDKNRQFNPIKAYYHSTCGGITELPENVWGNSSPGFRHSVSCPFCVSSPRYKWDLNLSESELSSAILKGLENRILPLGWVKQAKEIIHSGSLVDLWIRKTDMQKRVSELMMVWKFQNKLFEFPLSGVTLRDWLGNTRLRSTQFRISSLSSSSGQFKQWKFQGQGNGHGVGMCQWGAKVMGERGYKMEAILKYYYPDANLQRLY